ncbi:unnamed protein product, partial [Amoebophrya sp. A25]
TAPTTTNNNHQNSASASTSILTSRQGRTQQREWREDHEADANRERLFFSPPMRRRADSRFREPTPSCNRRNSGAAMGASSTSP